MIERDVALEMAHVQIELIDPALADSFAILDADARSLQLHWSRVTERCSATRGDLVDGRSHVLRVAVSAAWVVLYSEEVEAARHSVQLRAGELHELSY